MHMYANISACRTPKARWRKCGTKFGIGTAVLNTTEEVGIDQTMSERARKQEERARFGDIKMMRQRGLANAIRSQYLRPARLGRHITAGTTG